MSVGTKRAAGLILSVIMMVSSVVGTFAAAGTAAPSESDARVAVVYGVEAGVTVTAYQIIDAVYSTNGNGLSGYTAVDGLDDADMLGEDLTNVTAEVINKIATEIYNGTLTTLESEVLTYTTSSTLTQTQLGEEEASTITLESAAYYAELEAGMWIILVSDSNATVYNPMIVSNWYSDANDASSLQPGSVDAAGYFYNDIYTYATDEYGNVEITDGALTAVYAKSSPVSVDKDIVNYDSSHSGDSSEGADYDIGDTVQFKISTTIPDYSDTYFDNTVQNAVFMVIDDLSAGLDSIEYTALSVSVGGTSYDPADDGTTQYTIALFDIYELSSVTYYKAISSTGGSVNGVSISTGTIYTYSDGIFSAKTGIDLSGYEISGQRIVVSFAESFIEDHGNQSVVISYETTLNEDALIVGDTQAEANTNTADIVYSNHPTTLISASDYGADDTVYVYTFAITDELVKVYNRYSGGSINAYGSVSSDGNTVTAVNPLAGAEFTIYSDEDCSTPYVNDYAVENGLAKENEATAADGDYVYTVTSDENGYISFCGLSEGTYYITETEAPDGYTINDTVYKVVIAASYNTGGDSAADDTEGTLSGYTISVSASTDNYENEYTNTYMVSYTNDGASDLSETVTMTGESGSSLTYTWMAFDAVSVSAAQNPTAVVDTTLIKLPSTGGIGLYAMAAASIAVFAAAFIIASGRRKNSTKE